MALTPDPRADYGLGVGLHVADLPNSLRFYSGLLGCHELGRLRITGGTLVALAFGNSMLRLLQWDDEVAPSGPTTVAIGIRYLTFHVDDPDAAVSACESAGFEVVRSAYDFTADVRNAIVHDPDGNVVEFCRGMPWLT